MLTSTKQRMDREDEEGFTLIELMVVLLIIAILLAIAIPTFLGTRNTANARATQSNLNNALTAEQSYWTQNQNFGTTQLTSVEPSLGWEATYSSTAISPGDNNVLVSLYSGTASTAAGATTIAWATTGSTLDGVEISGAAKDNNCYTIFASDNASLSFTAYNITPGDCSTVPTTPTAAPTATSAAAVSSTSNSWATGW